MDMAREIPQELFIEIEPLDGLKEDELMTLEDSFYESPILGNFSLHLLTTEDESEYYMQKYSAYGKEWFKCIDIKQLKNYI